jgi:NTE family protein
LHALTLLIARQLISELENLGPQIDYYVLPPLCPLKGSPYDFSHTDELIARAIKSTNEWIDGGGLEVPRTHAQLGLHKHRH